MPPLLSSLRWCVKLIFDRVVLFIAFGLRGCEVQVVLQALSLLGSIGSLRKRTPVAKIALATGVASADVPGSPIPPGASLL